MLRTKKIIGFSVMGGAVVLATFTILVAAPSYRVAIKDPSAKNPVEKPLAAAATTLTDPQRPSGLAMGSVAEAIVDQKTTSASEAPDQNLTASIAKSIAAELLAKNPNGPSLLGGEMGILTEDPSLLIDAALTNELESFNFKSFELSIPVSRIIVQAADVPSKADVDAYAETVGTIIAAHYLTLGTTGNTPLAEGLSKFRDAARRAFQELIAVPVPRTAIAFHVRELELMAAQEKTITAALAGDADPLRALLAIQFLDRVNDEFATHNEQLGKLSL